MKHHNYYVYITTNPEKTVLYVGVTNDLDRRMEEHLEDNNGARKTFNAALGVVTKRKPRREARLKPLTPPCTW